MINMKTEARLQFLIMHTILGICTRVHNTFKSGFEKKVVNSQTMMEEVNINKKH